MPEFSSQNVKTGARASTESTQNGQMSSATSSTESSDDAYYDDPNMTPSQDQQADDGVSIKADLRMTPSSTVKGVKAEM